MEQSRNNSSDEISVEQELVVQNVPPSRRNISTKISKDKTEQLKKAWTAVKDGSMTMYRAANLHGVPVSTLWDWCQRTDIDKPPVVGRPCFLGTVLEDKLKEWIFEAARTGKYSILFKKKVENSVLAVYFIPFSMRISNQFRPTQI